MIGTKKRAKNVSPIVTDALERHAQRMAACAGICLASLREGHREYRWRNASAVSKLFALMRLPMDDGQVPSWPEITAAIGYRSHSNVRRVAIDCVRQWQKPMLIEIRIGLNADTVDEAKKIQDELDDEAAQGVWLLKRTDGAKNELVIMILGDSASVGQLNHQMWVMWSSLLSKVRLEIITRRLPYP